MQQLNLKLITRRPSTSSRLAKTTSPMIREYAIRTLGFRANNLAVILGILVSKLNKNLSLNNLRKMVRKKFIKTNEWLIFL